MTCTLAVDVPIIFDYFSVSSFENSQLCKIEILIAPTFLAMLIKLWNWSVI